jgi:aconitate hydratase
MNMLFKNRSKAALGAQRLTQL